MPRRQFCREEINRVVKMYREGRPLKEIMEVNRIARAHTVYAILNREGVTERRQHYGNWEKKAA